MFDFVAYRIGIGSIQFLQTTSEPPIPTGVDIYDPHVKQMLQFSCLFFPTCISLNTLPFVSFSKTISKKTPSLLQLWFPQSFEFVVCWPVRNGFPQLVGAPDHQWCNSLIGHVLCAGQCWASSSGQASPHHLGKRTELRALWAPPPIISLGQVGIPMGLI